VGLTFRQELAALEEGHDALHHLPRHVRCRCLGTSKPHIPPNATTDPAQGPMISPGYAKMAAEFHMSYNALNGGLGWGIFTIGISCFITNGLAVIWGRRPIFLLGNMCLFISSVWGYFAHSYGSLLASRIIGCIGMSPFEV